VADPQVVLRRTAILLLTALAGGAGVAEARTVNDPLGSLQWHLGSSGALQALDTARAASGSRAPVVAIVDTGIDLRHADLRKNLWTNPDEVAGNGIVDDVHGVDLVDDDGEPQDANGHGTHVAGLVGARVNNRRGVAGIARDVRLMAVRVLDADNGGSTDDVAAGVDYAVREGARVINLSLNGDDEDPALTEALQRAEQAGVLVVVSAGNDGRDLGAAPSYPACSTPSNVLAVAAVDRRGRLAGFSNRGACVDVAAPGVLLTSTGIGGRYERRSGTSQAAPLVAGAAALILARRPGTSLEALTRALRSGKVAVRGGAPRLSVRDALRAS
jgi:subtilisin family serine protease